CPRPPGPTLFPYTTLFRSRAQLVELEHYLSDVAPLVNVAMRGRRLRQRECAIDARMDAALAGVTQQRLDLGPEDLLRVPQVPDRSEEHTSELQSLRHLVCR